MLFFDVAHQITHQHCWCSEGRILPSFLKLCSPVHQGAGAFRSGRSRAGALQGAARLSKAASCAKGRSLRRSRHEPVEVRAGCRLSPPEGMAKPAARLLGCSRRALEDWRPAALRVDQICPPRPYLKEKSGILETEGGGPSERRPRHCEHSQISHSDWRGI